MQDFIVGVLLITAGLWIKENWGRIPRKWKGDIVRASNRMIYFAAFVIAPALILAFFTAAVLMGIYAGIRDWPDDAPVTFVDGALFLSFAILYGMGLYDFIPRPRWQYLENS